MKILSRLSVYGLIFLAYWAWVYIIFNWEAFNMDIVVLFQFFLCGLHALLSPLFRYGKWWSNALFAIVMCETVFWITLKWNPSFYPEDAYGIASALLLLGTLPLLAWEMWFWVNRWYILRFRNQDQTSA